jgi:signal transduction histidine kinase/DNA-binding response OmpR family regulator
MRIQKKSSAENSSEVKGSFFYGPVTVLLRVLCVILLLAFERGGITNATQPYQPKYSNPFTEPWRWQSFTELIGKGCRCMTEDSKGVLWFGVSGGVLQYNGLNWMYHPLFKDSVENPVVSLLCASDGSLYAGSNGGICVLKNGRWEKLKLDVALGDPFEHPYNKIPIIETADKSIWIGTHQGAVRIKDNRYYIYRDNAVYTDPKKFGELRKLPDFHVYSMFEDKNRNIFLGIIDGRILQGSIYQQDMHGNIPWRPVDSEPGYVRKKYPLIKVTAKGSVVVASGQNDGGVNIREGKKWKLFKSKKLFGIDDLYSDVIELKDGSICVGGIGRLFIYNNGNWKLYESTNLPFASNRLILYETRAENFFIIGLGNEVWRIDLSSQRWATFRGLSFQAEDRRGNKWFITTDGAIVKSDAAMQRWVRYTQADGAIDVPVVLIITKNGNVWVAGSDKQIAATACFDGKQWYKQLYPALGWGIDRRAVFEAKDGSLWLGSASDVDADKGQKGGLVRCFNINTPDKIKFEYHYADENFKLTGIYGIGETADGKIWAGQLGFYNYSDKTKKWERMYSPAGLNASFIDCMGTSPTGDLWVGTRTNGVFFLDGKTGKWSHYSIQDGLSSNSIIYIYVQSNNNVWVATNRDISHFDGLNWTKNSYHNFLKPKMDGVAIRSTKDGGIWVDQNLPSWYRKAYYHDSFSGESDDNYTTTRYYPDKQPPHTVITFWQEKIAQPGNVILAWSGNDPWKQTPVEQIQYSYRIDNNEWSSFTYKTTDIFLSLPAGDHTFEVRSRDRDGNIDPTPAKVSFYIVHPIWAQPWFILLIISFLSIIAFFMFHLINRNRIIQEMSETKMRLFANISHELRTPLTLIMGPLLKVIESPALNGELKRTLDVVNRNCHRLLRLINQVLDFRKLESGQLKFEAKKGDIIEFLKDEVSVFNEFAESKNIRLVFEHDEEKLEIWYDADKMEKIIFNILSNALKFTKHNGAVLVKTKIRKIGRTVSVNLGFKSPAKFSKWLEIEIKDSGIGISEKDLEKIFDCFFQVHDQSAAIGGTGIGLAVAKEMTKMHGGQIDVESREGEGTSFLIRIPVIEEDSIINGIEPEKYEKTDYLKMQFPEVEEEETAVNGERAAEGRTKILIVEDDADMRKYIREELESKYEVLEAINGEEGFKEAVNGGPELILSDIMMPLMDGLEFCKKIKTDERTSHIAVILLTARSSQEYKIEGLETGADDYIVKPFYSREFLIKIHNILETRKNLREKFGKSLQLEPSSVEITSVDQKFIKRAIEIIEEHMDDPELSVESFSRMIGMSRVSLYNKLKSLTSYSVQEFIFAIRLKRAAQLLKESGMTVTEIAYSVGFKDPSHFSKLFKKQYGISPKAYIKDSPEET